MLRKSISAATIFMLLFVSQIAFTAEMNSVKNTGTCGDGEASARSQLVIPETIEQERTYGKIEINRPNSNTDRSYDVLKFASIYTKNKRPRVVFFIDQKFNDAIGTHAQSKNQIDEVVKVDAQIQNEIMKNERNLNTERRWRIQDSIENAYIDAGVKVVDRSVILRLAEENKYNTAIATQTVQNGLLYDRRYANINLDMMNNAIETGAIKKYADYIVEITISDYQKDKFPTLRGRILDVTSGTLFGTVVLKHENTLQKIEKYITTEGGYKKIKGEVSGNISEKYEATSNGYKKVTEESELNLEKYSEKFSHKLMQQFENRWK